MVNPEAHRPVPVLTSSQAKRFMRHVTKTDYCWLWTGCGGEYGNVTVNYKGYMAHRVSYVYHKGEFPWQLEIRHKCDTPRCVNPDHLEPGTAKQNAQDRESRGRAGRGRAVLGLYQILAIRALYIVGTPLQDMANQFGVTKQSIWAIVHRKSYPNLDDNGKGDFRVSEA